MRSSLAISAILELTPVWYDQTGALLRERLLAASPRQLRSPVILDEVQKVPQLLDEVHWLIENRGRHIVEKRGEQFGKAEVDFVLGPGEVAVEVKGTARVDGSDFRSLKAFITNHRPRRAIVVCNERSPRVHDGIEVLPWREFLRRLWAGEILR